MNVPFLIARRYFFSKKKRNVINIISIIAMFIVAVATMALIIVLSVFNGLEGLIRSIYGSFDPDIKISAALGKSFETNEELLERIRKTPGVALITEVIEDNALLRYEERQMIVKMKGVSENFFEQNQVDAHVVQGSHVLEKPGRGPLTLIGRGIQYQLSVSLNNQFAPLFLMYPKNKFILDPEGAFRTKPIYAGGVFAIERQYDDSYVFVPLAFAEELLGYEGRRTALEIKTTGKANINKIKQRLQHALGGDFLVQNSDEQHVSPLRAIKVEKMFVFLTFAFILFIASLNIFFALSMLVIDKKKDIAILASMGASETTIRNIFLLEGMIVAFSGAAVGLGLGLVICWAQQSFGLVSMGMATSIVDAYPVQMEASDFLMTGLAIIIITLLVCIRPARRAMRVRVSENI